MNKLREFTLEMSLKPFKVKENDYIENVCITLFEQWKPLLKNTEVVDVLLWIGDGSEILEYSGDANKNIEWARYIGRANEFHGDWSKEKDPEKIGPHAKRYLYCENPPEFTYGDIKTIIRIIKKIGNEITGKQIKVGATFDPGPEFAVSEFKYNRHPEICTAGTMGDKSFVVSYETLHEDNYVYKAYPNGIKEGTPFATFLGKQCNEFLKDMEFDYIWFSNGFGFGAENWATTGPLFDGKTFSQDNSKVIDVKNKTLNFWKLFRAECPDYEVQTRGTNLSVGIDFATDGVATKEIYDGDFNIVPPPNSPWAALDKNFGLELSGYMSRISELPHDSKYMYRFYLHDPWWINSPWFDRYEGEPHDIYMPLAISRINSNLEIENPSYMNLLTVDTSFGELPDEAVNTVTPHVAKAIKMAPDKAAPIVWVYPFNEYQNVEKYNGKYNLKKAFFEDWFITSSINAGMPISTVVSTEIFSNHTLENNKYYRGSTLLCPVPYKDSIFEKSLIKYVENGGDVLLYGSLTNAGEEILNLLNIQITDAISGELTVNFKSLNEFEKEYVSNTIKHDSNISDGGIDTIIRDKNISYEVLSTVTDGINERVTGIYGEKDGKIVWVRGSNANEVKEGSNLLVPHDNKKYFNSELQLRHAMKKFNYHIEFLKKDIKSKMPALTIHRNNNAFIFSGYFPDTTVSMKMRFPLGVPLLIGHEVFIEDGYGVYNFPRSFNRECRVFVTQGENGPISMTEYGPVSIVMKRRVLLEGLKNATVYVFPEEGKEGKCELLLNSSKPNIVGEDFKYELVDTNWGKAYKAENVTGHIMYSTEFDSVDYLENRRKK
ncbi:hypothetical protein [Clostridium sp. Marseille-Q2269]|uniref:hypothetical protein n=1 Tax=Clostridium sp. Marseille-Q2269 TaxID=2942205 RepID=UPI0020738567|nr:hypothetical protein [Clostridium sp. Marseille-Q2269]